MFHNRTETQGTTNSTWVGEGVKYKSVSMWILYIFSSNQKLNDWSGWPRKNTPKLLGK